MPALRGPLRARRRLPAGLPVLQPRRRGRVRLSDRPADWPPTRARAAGHEAAAEPGRAIAGLVLNVVVWPGLGSLVAGRREGWVQGFLSLVGLLLIPTVIFALVGLFLLAGMWVSGLVSGVKAIQAASPTALTPVAS
jgi:hypothetical protein